MYEENHVIKVKSKERLFGSFVEATILISSKKNKNASKTGIERVIVDFKKKPAYVAIKHGSVTTKLKQLSTLEDKKLLVGKINISNLAEADDYLKAITLEGALSCFNKIPIDVDFKRADTQLGVPDCCNTREVLNVYYAMGDFYIYGKKISNLTESSVLCPFKKNSKVYTPQEGRAYVKSGNHFCEINIDKFKQHESYCINAIASRYYNTLKNFSLAGIDTSGSLKSYKNALKYLNIGSGYIPIRHDVLLDLSNGKKPSTLTYRDAKDSKDKLVQPINLGTSKNYFVSKDSKNAVIVGYSDEVIRKILESSNLKEN